MTKNEDKKILLMDEYKEGFKEISNMVEQFEELSVETQSIFIQERMDFLQEQLQALRLKKINFTSEMRKMVAQLNSRFKAYADNEKLFQDQIDECKSFIDLINNRLETSKAVQNVKGADTANADMQV